MTASASLRKQFNNSSRTIIARLDGAIQSTPAIAWFPAGACHRAERRADPVVIRDQSGRLREATGIAPAPARGPSLRFSISFR